MIYGPLDLSWSIFSQFAVVHEVQVIGWVWYKIVQAFTLDSLVFSLQVFYTSVKQSGISNCSKPNTKSCQGKLTEQSCKEFACDLDIFSFMVALSKVGRACCWDSQPGTYTRIEHNSQTACIPRKRIQMNFAHFRCEMKTVLHFDFWNTTENDDNQQKLIVYLPQGMTMNSSYTLNQYQTLVITSW